MVLLWHHKAPFSSHKLYSPAVFTFFLNTKNMFAHEDAVYWFICLYFMTCITAIVVFFTISLIQYFVVPNQVTGQLVRNNHFIYSPESFVRLHLALWRFILDWLRKREWYSDWIWNWIEKAKTQIHILTHFDNNKLKWKTIAKILNLNWQRLTW